MDLLPARRVRLSKSHTSLSSRAGQVAGTDPGPGRGARAAGVQKGIPCVYPSP